MRHTHLKAIRKLIWILLGEIRTELSNKEQAYTFGRNVFMGLMLEVAISV